MTDVANLIAANDHYLARNKELERLVAELRSELYTARQARVTPMRVIDCAGCGRTTTCVPVVDPIDAEGRTWCSRDCLEDHSERYWRNRWDHR